MRGKADIRRLCERKYNPKYGDTRLCICGHEYHRHFDWFDDYADVGCKYCPCHTFTEAPKGIGATLLEGSPSMATPVGSVFINDYTASGEREENVFADGPEEEPECCEHCLRSIDNCECSDADVCPEMGAKG